jgi:uncharacterized protein (TIGR02271 family)
MFDRTHVREGMTVYSSDGEKLGNVASCDASTFVIEKGFFFPKDYIARYDHVSEVTGDEVRLALTKDSFVNLRDGEQLGEGEIAASESSTSRATGEGVRMPVVEEELDVVKRDREAGEVRLKKDVVTETKRIDVPVTREEVRVERVPVSDREARPGESAFREDSVSVPIREEELEVRKRPVVKEEVRLQKERITEQRAAEADVRKERIDIEGEGGARRVDESEGIGTARRDPSSGVPRRDDDLP